jgi:hypothetical protein
MAARENFAVNKVMRAELTQSEDECIRVAVPVCAGGFACGERSNETSSILENSLKNFGKRSDDVRSVRA